VHSAEKRNVMKSGVLWHEVVSALHKESYSDVELDHILADNCAMQLVRRPKQFDVIVTDNLFGDMLSDVAAMLTGSLGMLPSASLGATDERTGRRKALYEPVHGSAPDIAGQGLANPIAMIASFAMALRYSFGLKEWAERLDQAIAASLEKGLRTPDIMQDGMTEVGTRPMGASIVEELIAGGGVVPDRLSAPGGGEAFALGALAGELAGAADGFGAFADAPLRGLLVVIAKLHFAKQAFALQLLLEHLESLVDIVVAYKDLHVSVSVVVQLSFSRGGY
jgi:hypothetical protein